MTLRGGRLAVQSPRPDEDVRERSFRARLRAAGVDEANADRLLDEWRQVARQRQLEPDDRRYWPAAADWLLVRISPASR
jgi:hypothetical protein